MASTPKAPTPTIVEQQAGLHQAWPFSDTQDFVDADRGFLGTATGQIQADDGRVVWDVDSYGFITGDAPASVNPSLCGSRRDRAQW